MAAIELHGMTWDHSRGYPCMGCRIAAVRRTASPCENTLVKNVLSLTFENHTSRESWQNGMICWLSTIHGTGIWSTSGRALSLEDLLRQKYLADQANTPARELPTAVYSGGARNGHPVSLAVDGATTDLPFTARI